METPESKRGSNLFAGNVQRGFGALLSLILVLGCGELYLRFFPPSDLHEFLGNDSPITGKLSPDPQFRVSFATWSDLQQDNPRTLGPGSRLNPDNSTAKKPWLFLGSSFGFAMQAECEKQFPDHPSVTLERREWFLVRWAQAKTLLENGSRPERIFFVTIPVDFRFLAEYRLRNYFVNDQGGAVIAPRLPSGPTRPLIANSRLGLGIWVRLGLHRAERARNARDFTHSVPDGLREDLDELFAAYGALCRQHPNRISIVHVPAKRSLLRNQGFALEDLLVQLSSKHGIDFVDLRPLFLEQTNREALYIPDGHLSDFGNQLVLRELKRRYPTVEASPSPSIPAVLTSHPTQDFKSP